MINMAKLFDNLSLPNFGFTKFSLGKLESCLVLAFSLISKNKDLFKLWVREDIFGGSSESPEVQWCREYLGFC